MQHRVRRKASHTLMGYKHPGYEELQILQCGHTRASAVKMQPGDTVLCVFRPQSHGYQEIVRTEPGYLVKCAGCAYARSYGAAQFEAQRAADKHARKFPLHTVAVVLGRRVVDVRRPRTILVELPFDVPPF